MPARLVCILQLPDWRKAARESSFVATHEEGVAGRTEVGRFRFCCVVLLCLSALLSSARARGDAGEDRLIRFDIPRQSADQALIEFAEQADVTFIFPVDETRKVTANAVRGELTAQKAIARLLAGTSLRLGSNLNGAWTVSVDDGPDNKGSSVNKRGVFAGFMAALTTWAGNHVRAQQPAELTASPTLQEVVVTAQKKEENLRDVPVPVTVLSADKLASTNQLRVEDYYTSVPGLSLVSSALNGEIARITVRGLSSGSMNSNPAVGTVIDDIPYGGSLLWGGGGGVPDVDPGDLARIEVLRGPQGTLYGAGSLGGLLKFETIAPSTEQLSGRVEIGTNTVKGGDDAGYNARGAVNIPLSDSFAVRASAFTYREPGYIDNVNTGETDVNEVKGRGGRLAALWRAADTVTLKLSALVQRTEPFGSGNVVDTLGDLKQRDIIGGGGFEKNIEAYSATLTADMGAARFTSLSGYNKFKNTGIAGDYFGSPNIQYFIESPTTKFSQEFRLDMPLAERIDWQVGAFYTKEDYAYIESLTIVDPVTGAFVFNLLDRLSSAGNHKELAAFSNFTFKLTDRFDVQVGGRQAHYKQDFQQIWTGPLAPDGIIPPALGSPYLPPHVAPKNDAFTYLLTPRFKLSPDWMIYLRLASGYRTGGPNSTLANDVLPVMTPDKTKNYELGVKGGFLEDRISVDASVYRIDWNDLQFNTTYLLPNGVPAGIFANADSAKSQGLELSLELRPRLGLKLGLQGAWNTAELTADMPPEYGTDGRNGDRLPYGAKFSGHFSVEQQFQLAADVTAVASGAVSYVGSRLTDFVGRGTGGTRQTLPSYTKTDLSLGVQYRTWDVDLYLNNVFDERGELAFDTSSQAAQLIRPRSVGVNLTKSF